VQDERMIIEKNLSDGINASKNSTLALVLLAALKGIVGFYSGSSALIADAVHTSLDIFTSFSVWIGLKLSLKSSGEKFPYGYYKAENLVALFVSVIILISGVELVRESLISIKDPDKIGIQGIALGAAVFSVFAIYAIYKYKSRIGRKIGSQALIADAMHSYTDVFSSLVVVAAISGSMLGMPWLDSIGVLLISLIIFRLGIGIARDSVLVLMDAWLDKGSITRINQAVGDIKGVNTVKDIRLRKSGLVVFGEVVIETEGDADLIRVEMLSEKIKKAVKKEIKNLEHVAVNARPGKMASVRIAVPVAVQDGLHSKLSLHLGKAPFFIIIDIEDVNVKNWDIIENPAVDLERKKGVKAAEFLVGRDVNVLIVHDIGAGPFYMLHDNFVKIMQMPEGAVNVKEVVDKVFDLNVITSPV
jgi:cation diffusion facilitator family transporter